MHRANPFEPHELWYGGWFELALELLGPDIKYKSARILNAIWSRVDIEGPFVSRDVSPTEQEVTSTHLGNERLYGILNLKDGRRLCCGTCLVTDELDLSGRSSISIAEVLFYIPGGSATAAYGGDCEASDLLTPEFHQLYNQLLNMADYIYGVEPFEMALIGHEVMIEAPASEFTKDELSSAISADCTVLLPQKHSLATIDGGKVLGKNLVRFSRSC